MIEEQIKEILNKRLKAVVRPYSKNNETETLYRGTPEELIKKLSNLLTQQREEAKEMAIRGYVQWIVDKDYNFRWEDNIKTYLTLQSLDKGDKE